MSDNLRNELGVLQERNTPRMEIGISEGKVSSLWSTRPKIIPRETKTSLQRKRLVNCKQNKSKISCFKMSEDSQSHFKSHVDKTPKLLATNTVSHEVLPSTQKDARSPRFGSKTPAPRKLTLVFKGTPTCQTPEHSNYTCVGKKTEKLVRGLDTWLVKHGRPLTCTNLKDVTVSLRNSLEGVEVSADSVQHSVSKVSFDESECTENIHPLEAKSGLLAGALEDLRNLLLMGFPVNESEEWLSAIKSCYSGITYEPLYWECLTFIRNFNENDSPFVGEALSKQIKVLEKKFESLKIASPGLRRTSVSSKRNPKVLCKVDFENFVPPNSISFAVTKGVSDRRGSDGSYLVTPVRRSNRRRTMASKEIIRSSYFDIEHFIRENSVFKPNPLLDFS